jgi:protein TonB
VEFVVDTLGRISNHKVVQSIGNGCDEEALRVARTLPNEWVPGRLGTKAVPVVYELPFTFRLN